MKLAYVTKTQIPSRTANSIHIMKICQAFADNGHQVKLICNLDIAFREPGVSDIYSYYGVGKKFEAEFLPWHKIPFQGYEFAFRAVHAAHRWGAELVYTRFMHVAAAACFLKTPCILEIHADIEALSSFQKSVFRSIVRSKHLKRIVVISQALKNYFVENYAVPDSLILAAHDGADLPVISQKPSTAGGSGKLKAAYVGHLYAGKGMEIIPEMARAKPEMEFHLIGGSVSDIEYWKERTRDVSNIIFHGFIPPSQVAERMMEMDVLLAPYQRKVTIGGRGDTSRWMSPLKIFEYMASRRPVVVSDLPVLREVFNERNAKIVPPDQSQAWIEALETLKNPVLRQTLSDQAYQDFTRHYTWQKRAQNVLSGI